MIYGSYLDQWFDKASAMIHDHRFVFMNHGYARLDGRENFCWVRDEDKRQKYSFNLVRYILDGVDIEENTVLDVGCGRGGACSYMANYLKPSKVFGLDYSKNNILFCLKRYNLTSLKFIQGDAHRLPFKGESFDVILNIESSHCYPDFPTFFLEVYRVLKNNGVFCFADTMSQWQFKKTSKLIKDSGVRILKEQEITRNVIKAIHLDSQDMRSFFQDMIQKKTGNQDLLEKLYDNITGTVLEDYMTGKFMYKLWTLKKP